MPWHLPEDLAFFKQTTSGHPVIMGRKTWETLEPRFRPLPGRQNVVVTRDPEYAAEGATIASSVESAIELAGALDAEQVWIMGGGELYRAAMPFASDLVVTKIDHDVEHADTFAPVIDDSAWRLVSQSELLTSETELRYHFERWTRRR